MTDSNETTADSKAKRAKRHVKKHKKKYGTASIIALLITALELVPYIKELIKTGDTAPLVEFGKTKLVEAQDAGIDF